MTFTQEQKNKLTKIKAADAYALKSDEWLSLFPEAKNNPALKTELQESLSQLTEFEIMAPIETRLKAIRAEMEKQDIDAYVVFRGDEFNNEYVPACNERLLFATGFTGSAGFAIITQNEARIFVDSRYTLQVRDECSSSLFSFDDLGKDSLLNWIENNIQNGQKFAVDGKILNAFLAKTLGEKLKEKPAEFVLCENSPLDTAWEQLDRPPQPLHPVVLYDEKLAGRTHAEKKQELVSVLKQENADFTIFNELDSIAWFLNIRGRDIPCTPVALSYLIAHQDGRIEFFIDKDKITDEVKNYFSQNNITCFDIGDFYPHLGTLQNKKAALNLTTIPVAVCRSLEQSQTSITQIKNPCSLPKALKTKSEQNAIIEAHQIDGIALVKFLHWVETTALKQKITELDCGEQLQKFREEHPEFKGPSFDTIAGFGANGAIVHYRSSEKTNKVLEAGNLFLCDSGGQYFKGTTDVTRTIVIGAPKEEMAAEMKDRFTRVLKGHIGIALCEMEKGTTGADIDEKARASLKEAGVDYGHGTGHGVGIYLSVHEGPQGISPRATVPFEAGMVISNEPGYYKAGEYGIRIENLVLVQEKANGKLFFRTLTLAPIDRNLIELSLLDEKEIAWLDNYHEHVYQTLAPHLDGNVKKWLRQATAPLHQPRQKKFFRFLGL